jgi:HD-like signal output (HDOD) protein
LRRAFENSSYTPPVLPSVAVELLALTRQPNVALRQVVQLMERDQFLAGEVVRISQSAAYGPAVPVRSIDEAIQRVGLRRVDQVFLRAAMEARVFRAPGYSEQMERLRHHSVATAELARSVCRQTSLYDDFAYLCGLLHDVGIAGCLIVLGEGVGGSRPPFDRAWYAIKKVHAACAQTILTLWQLPEELRLILSHHHSVASQKQLHPVAAATYLAELLACRLDVGFEDEQTEIGIDNAVATLRLGAGQLEQLRAAATKTVERLKG